MGQRVAVEKLKKQNRSDDFFIKMPDQEEFLGVIKLIGPDCKLGFKEDQKVYFETKFQSVRMGGMELCVMDETNILAYQEEA